VRRPLGLALAVIAIIGGARAHAATLYSSSKTFNSPYENSFRVQSNRFKPSNGLNGFIPGNTYQNFGGLDASVTSASVTVDVDADTGHLTAMGIGPLSVTPSSAGQSISTDVKIVVADFPNPPVIQTISGTWQESITFTGVSGAAPTFTPAGAPSPLAPELPFIPWYEFFQSGILTGDDSIFLTGTYQVIGPLSTTTVPINIELQPVAPGFAGIYVQGSNTFGDGFNFLPRLVGRQYNVVNPMIFEGEVDHLQFSVHFSFENGGRIDFAQNALPEPSCCMLLGMSGMAFVGLRRRQR
jgi:hypothetical protein